MGLVFMARHKALGKSVAIKTLRAEIAAVPDLVGRFEQEARAASAIGHPNIVEVFDLGSSAAGCRYMVMEHLDGQSLGELLEQTRVLMPGRAVNIASQVLSALAAAHASGIVHRDLKPENIFITHHHDNPEFVKLLDFGISKVLDAAAPHIGGGMKMTRFGEVIGTPLYMSPEQASGQPDLDHRTDLWSIGCVLYEMFTGTTPYDGDNYNQIMGAILKGEFKRPRQIRPALPEAIELVILKALAHEREARYQSATELRTALVAALEQGAVSTTARPSGAQAAAPAPRQGVADTERLPDSGEKVGEGRVTAAERALASALSRIEAGAVALGAADGSVEPTGAPAEARPGAEPVAPDPQPVGLDRFAPPDAQADEANPLTVDRSGLHSPTTPSSGAGGVAEDSLLAPRLRSGAASASSASFASSASASASASARAARMRGENRAGVGTVLKIVFLIALVGGGGFYGYQYYTRPKPPAAVAIEFRTVPADAEIFVAGEPLTSRPLIGEAGRRYELEFRAPGRMRARRTVTPSAASTITVRLPLRMPPLEPLALVAARNADSNSDTTSGRALYQDVDRALEKLSLYARCLQPLASPLAASRTAYAKSAASGKIRRGRLPVVKVLPSVVVNGCRLDLANASDRKPEFKSLDARGRKLLAALNGLVSLLNRLEKYYREGEYRADGFKLGRRRHAVLRKGLDDLTRLHRAVFSAVMVARMYWQQRELDTIAASEGLGAHWQLRRIVLASQRWVWSALSSASSQERSVARGQLLSVYQTAVSYSQKEAQAMSTIDASAEYLATAKSIVDLARRASDGKKPLVDELLARHNTSVKAFNAMIL